MFGSLDSLSRLTTAGTMIAVCNEINSGFQAMYRLQRVQFQGFVQAGQFGSTGLKLNAMSTPRRAGGAEYCPQNCQQVRTYMYIPVCTVRERLCATDLWRRGREARQGCVNTNTKTNRDVAVEELVCYLSFNPDQT